MKIRHTEPYAPKRAARYPAIGDQLDAVYKLAVALRAQGMTLPPETQAWIAQVQAVKAAIPKS